MRVISLMTSKMVPGLTRVMVRATDLSMIFSLFVDIWTLYKIRV
jgi:hypothetical protein